MSLGECYFCGNPLTSEDEVVMVKSGMRPDYAHRECVPKILRPQKDSATRREARNN